MKALLLAAGLGTRLRPITDHTPKCLVPIKGKALMDIWLDDLTEAGVGPFLINTHYLHDQVARHLENSKHRDIVTVIYEHNLLGTAGTLRANADFFGNEDGMLIHADNYCKSDFQTFLATHNQKPAYHLMTMMTFRAVNPSSCGIVKVDNENTITEFYEKVTQPPGNLANGAVYILNNDLIRMVANNNDNDFSTQTIPSILGRISNFENLGIHIDVGTQETYRQAQLI